MRPAIAVCTPSHYVVTCQKVSVTNLGRQHRPHRCQTTKARPQLQLLRAAPNDKHSTEDDEVSIRSPLQAVAAPLMRPCLRRTTPVGIFTTCADRYDKEKLSLQDFEGLLPEEDWTVRTPPAVHALHSATNQRARLTFTAPAGSRGIPRLAELQH